MLPEIGQLLLLAATSMALVNMTTGLLALRQDDSQWLLYQRPLAQATCLSLIASMVMLGISFLNNDFSVAYIAQHSNTQLPVIYKIAAVWAGHEGSFLFWLFAMSFWAAWLSLRSKNDALDQATMIVLSGLLVLFGLFVLLTSNPFDRLATVPFEGRDLNPMLQDLALVLHPPTLYLGYLGLTIAFAYAIAALWLGQGRREWARRSGRWTLGAWLMLTGGIALGSWWAYYELGWGGWWFWDPVENASLLPWLTATALLHSLKITAQGRLQRWSLLLAISSFGLCILGTFIVRSGVLTSVHAFAVNPTRGVVLLGLLFVIVSAALVLFALRAYRLCDRERFQLRSMAGWIMMGNGLLVIAAASVLLGTFYPLIFQVLNLGVISVGAPYFNAIFVPLVLLAALLMGASFKSSLRSNLLGLALVLSLGLALQWLLFERWDLLGWISCAMAIWIAMPLVRRLRNGTTNLAMTLGHLGLAFAILGASLSAQDSYEVSARMGPGDSQQLRDFQVTYMETELAIGPNYTAEIAHLEVYHDGEFYAHIAPERRFYPVRAMTMSEPGIHWTLSSDLYISLGEKLDRGTYALRIQYKPYIRWIWVGALLMMAGALAGVLRGRRPVREGATDVEKALA